MIRIQKNSTNRVVLTLNEKATLYNPLTGGTVYFLFEFINDQTKQSLLFNPVYISASTLYNSFNIIESGSNVLTGGTINIQPGYYSYSIYEQSTQYNLNISNTISVVEKGKVLCILPLASNFQYTANTNNNIVYYQ